MTNKFLDYLSSNMTKQQTLIEKQNLILKYLTENPTVNMFIASDDYETNIQGYLIARLEPVRKAYVGDLIFFNNGYIGMIYFINDSVVEPYYQVDTATLIHPIKGEKGDKGVAGNDGVGIMRFATLSHSVSGNQTITNVRCYLDNMTTQDFQVYAQNGTDGQNGAKGEKGNGIIAITAGTPTINVNKTVTPITVETDIDSQTFNVEAQNGERGLTGTGIVSVQSGESYEAGEDTVTPITFRYSDDTTQDVGVRAKNGKQLYFYRLKFNANQIYIKGSLVFYTLYSLGASDLLEMLNSDLEVFMYNAHFLDKMNKIGTYYLSELISLPPENNFPYYNASIQVQLKANGNHEWIGGYKSDSTQLNQPWTTGGNLTISIEEI